MGGDERTASRVDWSGVQAAGASTPAHGRALRLASDGGDGGGANPPIRQITPVVGKPGPPQRPADAYTQTFGEVARGHVGAWYQYEHPELTVQDERPRPDGRPLGRVFRSEARLRAARVHARKLERPIDGGGRWQWMSHGFGADDGIEGPRVWALWGRYLGPD